MTRPQALTRLVATKIRLVCGKLLARQILIRFDSDKKSADLRQKIGQCAAALGRTKLTNSLGKQQLKVSTRTWSGRAPWNRGKFVSQLVPSKRFFAVFFYFWVGRYNNTLNDWSRRKQWDLFPFDLSVPLGFASGTLGCRGDKTHCFPWGQSLSTYYRLFSQKMRWRPNFSLQYLYIFRLE